MKTVNLLAGGYIGALDAVVQIREVAGDPHSGAGGRAHAVTLAGGLSFEVLPERGLDLGAVWYAGQPIAWRAPLGSPGLAPTVFDWLGRFGGGLLVTCGLDNIGLPRGKYGQHGSHHETRAYDVALRRVSAEDGTPGVEITGTIDSVEIFGRRVRVYREIRAFADDPQIRISDRVVNEGAWPAPCGLLYHINFGAPLVLPGTRIDVDAAACEVREPSPVADDPTTFPEATDQLGETVWQHTGLASVDGITTARVSSPAGLAAEVSWRTAELPRLVQWVFPSKQSWGLGIEPANAPMWGPERETPDAGMPVLQPGEFFQTSVSVRLSTQP